MRAHQVYFRKLVCDGGQHALGAPRHALLLLQSLARGDKFLLLVLHVAALAAGGAGGGRGQANGRGRQCVQHGPS